MFDFPNSPTLNQEVTSPGGVTWRWDGSVWNILKNVSIPDAPSDGKTYARVNNVWRQIKERFTLAGVASVEIAVPAWATFGKFRGRAYQSSAATNSMWGRLKFGSTLYNTAGNYNWNGYLHDSQAALFSHYNNVTSGTGAILTNSGGSTIIPHSWSMELNVARDSTAANFDMTHHGSNYGGNTYYIIDGHTNLVAGLVSNLRIDAVVFAGTGNWAANSFVEVEWSA